MNNLSFVIFLIASLVLIVIAILLILRQRRRSKREKNIEARKAATTSGSISINSSSPEVGSPLYDRDRVLMHLPSDNFSRKDVTPCLGNQTASSGAEKTKLLRTPEFHYSVRLDVAGPHNAIRDRWFNTAVCIKTPNSPILKQEGLQNIVSKMGDVLNYDPKSGVKLKIEPLPSSDFDFQPNCFTFFLHHNLDSEVFFFSICPRKIGTVTMMFCLSQVDEGFAIASQPLFIRVEMPIEVRPTDQSHSMQGFARGMGNLQLALSESESRVRIDILNILDHKFVLSEIKELLFNLGLDMENYAGSTRREKIIEIILHFIRLGKINLLAKEITQMRPDLASDGLFLQD